MHALYHFLINVDKDETIAGAQYGQFGSFVEDKFDDNNWHTPLILTHKDGGFEFSDDNYRGGVDAWIPEEDKADWGWDKAVKSAYDCLYWEINKDLNLITENDYNFDRGFESPADAAKAIAKTLAESYQSDLDGKLCKWEYVRPRLAKTYEGLRDSYFEAPFLPAYDFSPYSARTFDLTDGEDDGLAILTVDVHT